MPPRIASTLRLPEANHFPAGEKKTGIAIHHTVGGSAESSVRWWSDSKQMLGTAYVIERDGTIFEVFDPTAWAWQFGLPWARPRRVAFEKRFIGIEIASEGALTESNGQLYCFDRVTPRTLKPREECFDFGASYRGFRYFDRYEPAQIDSLVQLVDDLCTRFDIPRRVPAGFIDFHGDRLANFEGIIGHAMVREDKSDPLPDTSLWERLVSDLDLKLDGNAPAAPGATRPSGGPSAGPASTAPATGAATNSATVAPGGSASRPLTPAEIDALFEHNIQQIDVMRVAAGSMVKGLIMELERAGRNTYIRLRNPAPNGHTVEYDFVRGDRSLVGRIGRALGFASVTDSRLEVRGG